jgi:hypothetical protein
MTDGNGTCLKIDERAKIRGLSARTEVLAVN